MKKTNVLTLLAGIGVGAAGAVILKKAGKKTEKSAKNTDVSYRYEQYYGVLCSWLQGKNNGSIRESLSAYKDKVVGIYGMGCLGELLYSELKNNEIKVAGFVDKNADNMVCGMDDTPVMPISDMKDRGIETVIITPVYAYEDIKSSIEEICGDSVDIVSIEDIFS